MFLLFPDRWWPSHKLGAEVKREVIRQHQKLSGFDEISHTWLTQVSLLHTNSLF